VIEGGEIPVIAGNWSGGRAGRVPVDAAGVRRGRGGKTLPDKRAPYAADPDVHNLSDRG
jgi:hypothetical protein